jgi:hypothetical protein
VIRPEASVTSKKTRTGVIFSVFVALLEKSQQVEVVILEKENSPAWCRARSQLYSDAGFFHQPTVSCLLAKNQEDFS